MRRIKAALCVLALVGLAAFLVWLEVQRQECEARGGKLVQAMYLEVVCVQPMK